MKLTLVLSAIVLVVSSTLAQGNIVQVATGAGLTTLLDLVGKANLAGPLTNGAANLTVLAPTNAAFAALPPSVLNIVSQRYNQDLLRQILLYHVFGNRFPSTVVISLAGGNTPATLQGSTIAVTNNGGVLRLNGARVITPDVPFLNGNKLSVVHVIDSVLVPPAPFSLPPTITDIVVDLNSKGQFTFLFKALTEFGNTFTDLLSRYTKAGYTVFAPTDDAFKRLPARYTTFPVKPRCRRTLEKILKFHVVHGFFPSAKLNDNTKLRTLASKRLEVERREKDRVFVDDGVRIIQTDIRAANGIIHVVGEVLLYWD